MSVELEAIRLLRFGEDYLSNPDRWTRGAFVRYVDGSVGELGVHTDCIVCADIAGALRLAPKWSIDAAFAASKALAIAIEPEWKPTARGTTGLDSSLTVVAFNDDPDTTHADVMRVICAAIAGLQNAVVWEKRA
jgi:hypothetical protein